MSILDYANEIVSNYFKFGNCTTNRYGNKFYVYFLVNRQKIWLHEHGLKSAQNKINIILSDYNIKLELAYENVRNYGTIAVGFKLMPIG